jgi:hypothetical protein
LLSFPSRPGGLASDESCNVEFYLTLILTLLSYLFSLPFLFTMVRYLSGTDSPESSDALVDYSSHSHLSALDQRIYITRIVGNRIAALDAADIFLAAQNGLALFCSPLVQRANLSFSRHRSHLQSQQICSKALSNQIGSFFST